MWSCPSRSHAHSRLATFPSFTAKAVEDARTFRPLSPVWLSCPRFGHEVQSLKSACCCKSLWHTSQARRTTTATHTDITQTLHGCNTLAHFFISESYPDQLDPNISAGNTSPGQQFHTIKYFCIWLWKLKFKVDSSVSSLSKIFLLATPVFILGLQRPLGL